MTSTGDQPPSPRPAAPVGRLASVSLDCTDPDVLAGFYGSLLGLPEVFRTPDGGLVAVSDGTVWLTMMRVADHVAPTWPDPGQLQQIHLDIAVDELDGSVVRALQFGAVEAEHQPQPDSWRVLIDPAGHPFCLSVVRAD